MIYNEQPNEMAIGRLVALNTSIGMTLLPTGTISDVIYNGPSFAAGLAPGMKVTAVNGEQFSPDAMKNAIDAAKGTTAPIELIVTSGSQYRTYSVDYHGGIRNPHLVRDPGKPDYLSEILHPLASP